MKVRYNTTDIALAFNHNTDVLCHAINRLNRKVRHLKSRNRSIIVVGIIFGAIAAGLCRSEQNEKIDILTNKVCELETEIDKIKKKKGD